jgi:hypothetical protein
MTLESGTAAAKNATGVFRELLIIFGMIFFVLHFNTLSTKLSNFAKRYFESAKNAGATHAELNLGLGKWVFDTASDQIGGLDTLRKMNEEVEGLAQLLINSGGSPENVKRARDIQQMAQKLDPQLQASISSVKTTQLALDQVIQQDQVVQAAIDQANGVAQAAIGQANGPGSYGIVVSADKQDDLAKYEVHQLKDIRHIPDVVVYDRQGFLRTVALFRDKAAADKALPDIQSYRKTAYLINLSKWCGTPQESAKRIGTAPVVTCQQSN